MDFSVENDPVNSGCVEKAFQALKGLSRDDINNYLHDFKRKLNEGSSVEDALNEQTARMQKILEDRKNLLHKSHKALLDNKEAIEDNGLRVRDLIGKQTDVNKGRNIESLANERASFYQRSFMNMLSKEAQDIMLTGKYDKLALKAMDTGTFPKEIPQISEISNALKKIKEIMDKDQRDSGSLSEENYNKNYKFGIHYDPVKVGKIKTFPRKVQALYYTARGKEIPFDFDDAENSFVKTMLDNGDHVETFGMNADKDAIKEKSFKNMFNNILQGRFVNKENPENVRVEPDIIKKRTMFYAPKNWESYGNVLSQYGVGNGSLIEQLHSEFKSVGRKVATTRVLGPDPYWAFNKLQDVEIKKYGKQPIVVSNKNLFNQVMGATNTPVNPYLAQVGANYRAWSGMVKLPFLAPLTLNDTNFGLHLLSTLTKTNYFQNFISKLDFIAKTYKGQISGEMDPQISRILNNLHLAEHYGIGALSNHVDANSMGNVTRRVSNTFFKVIGMAGKDIGNIAGAVFLGAKSFGDFADKAFGDLPDHLSNFLKAYGISPAEWELTRNNLVEDNGSKLYLPDVIDSVKDEDIKPIADSNGNSVDKQRALTSAKIYSMIETWANETVLTPGAYDHALLNQGLRSGTISGETVRSFFQFKGFLASYINRMLIDGYKQDSSKMKYKWALSNFIYTLPLTFASNLMYNTANGYDLNADPTKWKFNDFLSNATPGLNIFYNSLNPSDRNQNAVFSLLQSPSMVDMSDLLKLGGSSINLLNYNDKDIDHRAKVLKSNAGKAVYDMTPLNSIPIVNKWWRNNVINSEGR